MEMPISRELLRRDPELAKVLEESFDFIVNSDDPPDTDSFRVRPAGELRYVARDASGGEFYLYGDKQYVLYVSSEGQAGIVARGLVEFMHLLAAHPYWQGLLKFSAGGRLDEMRQAAVYLEEDEGRARKLQKDRRLLRERLGLRDWIDPIAALHAAVSELNRDVAVSGPDGTPASSMFNRFPAARLRPPPRK